MSRAKKAGATQPASSPSLTRAEVAVLDRRATTDFAFPKIPPLELPALAERVRQDFAMPGVPVAWDTEPELWWFRERVVAAWGMERKRRREAERDDLPPIATPRPVTMTKERETRLIDATRRTTAAVSRGESVPDALWEYT